MDNKKLLEGLLKADGINPAGTTDSERIVFNKMLDEQFDTKQSKPCIIRPDLWRRIVANKFSKLASAAVIIAAVLLGLKFAGGPDLASVAWADVQTAFLSQSWVHLNYDNGTESWYNLKTGDHCHKQLYTSGNSFVYINQKDNLRQRYTPAHGRYIDEDRPTIYKDNIILPYEPQTSWDAIVGHWEKTAKTNDSEYWKVEIKNDTLNGSNIIRFDIYYIDALERKLLNKQLWADPLTKLPIKIMEILSSQERKDQNRESITGVFSFPKTGPLSIYDLDVPKDLPIVKNYDKPVNPSVEEIIRNAKMHYDRFPKRCRAVIWQNDYQAGMVELLWRDGEKIRFNHYSTVGAVGNNQLVVPASLEDVIAWSTTQPPINIYMDDGKKNYCRRYHPAFEDLKTPKTRVTRSWFTGLPETAHFIEEQWEYMSYDPKRFILIDDAPEALSKYVGLKTESGDIRRDYYIDPKHDYIQVQNTWWKRRDGQWKKEREYITTEMIQLPDGQWYVAKRKLTTYPEPENGLGGSEYNYTINITLLKSEDFPPDTFNGEKLLEGAEIETY